MDKVFYSLQVEGNYKPSAASRRIMTDLGLLETLDRRIWKMNENQDIIISVLEGIHVELISIRESLEKK